MLVSSLLLVLWTMARPAHAMPAAFCDDRGASAVAPPPALDAPDVVIARVRVALSCPGQDLPLFASLGVGHRGVVPSLSTGLDAALPIAPAWLVPPAGEELDAPAEAARPLDGVRARIERPPRG